MVENIKEIVSLESKQDHRVWNFGEKKKCASSNCKKRKGEDSTEKHDKKIKKSIMYTDE